MPKQHKKQLQQPKVQKAPEVRRIIVKSHPVDTSFQIEIFNPWFVGMSCLLIVLIVWKLVRVWQAEQKELGELAKRDKKKVDVPSPPPPLVSVPAPESAEHFVIPSQKIQMKKATEHWLRTSGISDLSEMTHDAEGSLPILTPEDPENPPEKMPENLTDTGIQRYRLGQGFSEDFLKNMAALQEKSKKKKGSTE